MATDHDGRRTRHETQKTERRASTEDEERAQTTKGRSTDDRY